MSMTAKMALNFVQFRALVHAESQEPGDICPQCAIESQTSTAKSRGICSSCYFDEFGKEIDDSPIFMPRKTFGT